MFTGIVEEIGTIRSVTKDSKRFVLDIGCSRVLEGTKEGDSIAVNGVLPDCDNPAHGWLYGRRHAGNGTQE